MRDGVDQGFLPGKSWVLEPLAKKQIVEDRAFANMFFDPAHRFIDQSHQRCFETDPFNDVQRATMLPVRPFIFYKIDACPGMPAAWIFGKKQQGGHIRTRQSTRKVKQMVRLAEQRLRIFPGLDSVDERRHQIRIEIEPSGVERLLSLEENIFFGFLKSVDLIGGQRWSLVGDAVKGATARNTIDFQS